MAPRTTPSKRPSRISRRSAAPAASTSLNVGALVIGKISDTQGVTAAGGGIGITASSPLTVDEPVIDTAGGTIALTAADDGDGDDHLTINAAVRTFGGAGTGAVVLLAGDNALLRAPVSSAKGLIIVTADAVFQEAEITTGGSGSVTVTADSGSITMDSGTTTTTAGGQIRYTASGDVGLSILSSASGAIEVTASGGAITDRLDGEAANLATAGAVTLSAAAGIGSGDDIDTSIGTLTAGNSGSGNIAIQETNGLTVGVGGVRTLGGNGNVSIDVDAGGLTITGTVTAHGSGTVTLNADAGSVEIGAVIRSGSGAIAVSGDAVLQGAEITTGGSGSVTVAADGGSITMASGTTTATAGGQIRYTASGDVGLSILSSATGSIEVTASGGAITDRLDGEAANLSTAGAVTLSAAAGIGSGDDIDTLIGTLTASNSGSGNIAIQETNGLTVGVGGIRTLGGNGNVSVDVDAGGLTITGTLTAHGSGTVTLNADAGSVEIGAVIRSGSGAIAVSADAVLQEAEITTGGSGSVTVAADGGSITMASGTTTATAGGQIRYTASSDVGLSILSSASGAIEVTASGGAITDRLDGEAANLATAGAVTLSAAAGIGSGDDIDTSIGTLTAGNSGSGNIAIQETNGLTVGVGGIRTLGGNGNVSVDVDAGGLTITGTLAAHGSGTVTLNADAGSVEIGAVIRSASGAIAVSGDAVLQEAEITTGGSGGVTVTADGGSITMASGTTTATAGGQIRYTATGDAGLSILSSASGAIEVTASGGAITDRLDGEAANVLTGGQLALRAGSGIGEGTAPNTADLDVAVTRLAASTSSGNIHVECLADHLTIDTCDGLSGVSITNADAVATGSDCVTLRVSGPLTVAANCPVVNNDGGTIVLAAEGNSASADLTLSANVTAANGDGDVRLYAGDTLRLTGTAAVSAAGIGSVLAASATNFDNGGLRGTQCGDVFVASGASIVADRGDITLLAENNIDFQAGTIQRTGGSVFIQSDVNDADPAVGTRMNLFGSLFTPSAQIKAGTGDDEINFAVTPGQVESAVVAIQCGGGDDRITITGGGNDSPRIVVNGDQGSDRLIVDHSADTLDNAGTLTAATLYGLGVARGLDYLSIEWLDVLLGSGNDRLDVTATLPTCRVSVRGNAGNDTFNIGAGNLDSVEGAVTIDGGNGLSDRIFLFDDGNALSVDYLVTPSSVTSSRSPNAPPQQGPRTFGGLNYDGTTESLRVEGTQAANVFDVQPSLATRYFIDGNLPGLDNTLARNGDFLKLDTKTTFPASPNGADTSGRTLTITNRGEGSWTFKKTTHQSVDFASIERFNHVELVAVGADAGTASKPRVRVYDAETNELKFEIAPSQTYGSSYRQGVRVATGDVDNDGLPDVVVVPGKGLAAEVKIFSGAPMQGVQGTEIVRLRIPAASTYGKAFRNGVQVAVADVVGDGLNDIVLVPSRGAALVKVFENRVLQGKQFVIARSFNAFADYPRFVGGATVAAADMDGDTDGNGKADILVASGSGMAGLVRAFDVTVAKTRYTHFAQIADPDRKFKGGLSVAVGDVNGDNIPDIITGAGASGKSCVRVYNGNAASGYSELISFRAFDTALSAPIRVVARDIDGDNLAEILAVQGPDKRAACQVKRFKGLSGSMIDAYFATHPDFSGGGLFIG